MASGARLLSVGGSGIGLGIAAALFVALDWLLPPIAAASTADRLGLAALALLPGALVLALMIGAQMLLRFATGAFDPIAGSDSRALIRTQRAITNTVEQLAVFAPAMLALAAAGAPMRGVAALGVVFGVARLAFWLGYAIHPLARAPGMAATGACSLAALGWAGLAWAGLV
ncbi:MAPEG family protein [Elioraea tepidiphila]|uniref:MAPEG family protein n=1 Tax=Elioraea tepidiphila TaxID=457934 RepID=UPI000378DA68|nr:MAPEG family protein [Elioraea tepidiphila]